MYKYIINGFDLEMEKQAIIGKLVGSLLKAPLKLIRKNPLTSTFGGMAVAGTTSKTLESVGHPRYIPGT